MKKLLVLLVLIGCGTAAIAPNWESTEPTQAPAPIKAIPFNSKPVMMSDGIIICEDGSMWAVIKVGDRLMVEQQVPAMEVEDE